MKNSILILLTAISTILAPSAKAQLYTISSGKVDFFSKTPLENIEAHSSTPKVVMNIQKLEFGFIVSNTSFEFPNKLMQEHFNEKYIESEKYPMSTFSGKVNEIIDLTKDGTYTITVTGKLNIHGVTMDRTIPGIITVKNGEVNIKSTFKVTVKDHKIEIPSVVGAKIAEEIDVTVDVNLTPKK